MFLFLILLFALYKISNAGALHSLLHDQHSRDASKEKRQILNQMKRVHSTASNNFSWLKRPFDEGFTGQRIECFIGRLRAVENSTLANNLFLSASFFLILLILGSKIILQNSNWEGLIIYLIALRYSASTMRTISRSLTSVNRFYPQIRNYFRFINKVTPVETTVDVSLEFKTAEVHIEGTMDTWKAPDKARIGLLSPLPIHRYSLTIIADALFPRKETADAFIYNTKIASSKFESIENTSLEDMLNIPDKEDIGCLVSKMPASELTRSLQDFVAGGLDRNLSGEEWETVTPEIKFSFSILSLASDNCSCVFVAESDLQPLAPGIAEFFLDILEDKAVFILFTDEKIPSGCYGESMYMVIDDLENRGMGTTGFIQANWNEIKSIHAGVREKYLIKIEDGKEANTDEYDDAEDEDDS